MRSENATMIHLEKAYSSSMTTRRPRSQSAPRTRLAMQRQEVVYRNSSATTVSQGTLGKENVIPVQPTHNRIVINVGGRRFQTTVETLLKVPETVLSELARSHLSLSRDQQVYEYFFDRSAIMFEDIIDYYRTGSLHFPQDACPDKVKQEMVFWKLPRSALSDSSWLRYLRQREIEYDRETIRRLLSHKDAAVDKKVLRVGNATAVVYDPPSLGGTLSRLYHDNIEQLIPDSCRGRILALLLTLRSCRSQLVLMTLLLFSVAIPLAGLLRLAETGYDLSIPSSVWVVFMSMTTVGYQTTCVHSFVGHFLTMVATACGITIISAMLCTFLRKYWSVSEALEDCLRLRGKWMAAKGKENGSS